MSDVQIEICPNLSTRTGQVLYRARWAVDHPGSPTIGSMDTISLLVRRRRCRNSCPLAMSWSHGPYADSGSIVGRNISSLPISIGYVHFLCQIDVQ
jgi:hypothetical protein